MSSLFRHFDIKSSCNVKHYRRLGMTQAAPGKYFRNGLSLLEFLCEFPSKKLKQLRCQDLVA